MPKGVIAGWDKSITARSLDSRFSTDGAGQRKVVTVLFPHDGTHAKGALRRLSGAGYTGARVTQGAIKDYVVASDGGSVSRGDATFTAEAAVFRRHGKRISFYFMRSGVAFDSGDGQGATSDQPVSVHLRGKSGSIMAAAPSVVTFRRPGITEITIDGKAAYPTRVAGGLRVTIPSGRHGVALS